MVVECRTVSPERRWRLHEARTINLGNICGSCGLQDYAFDHVGYVFAFVHGGFDDFENFFPLDDLHRVFFFVEELRDQGATEAVALVFVAIDFDAVLERLIRRADGVYGGGDFDGGGDENFDELDGAFANGADAIEHETAGGGVDQVDDIVELGCKCVDV